MQDFCLFFLSAQADTVKYTQTSHFGGLAQTYSSEHFAWPTATNALGVGPRDIIFFTNVAGDKLTPIVTRSLELKDLQVDSFYTGPLNLRLNIEGRTQIMLFGCDEIDLRGAQISNCHRHRFPVSYIFLSFFR